MQQAKSVVALLMLAAIIALSRIPGPSAAQWEEGPLIPPATGTALVAPTPEATPDADPQPDAHDPNDGATDGLTATAQSRSAVSRAAKATGA